MAQVIARIRVGSKHFEILVEAEEALKFKKTGEGNVSNFLDADIIFTDSKKGLKAGASDLEEAFGTSDVNEVAAQIIKRGEVQIPQDVRDAQRGERFKQVVDFLVKNSTNAQTSNPFTPERIERALDEIGVNIQNKPIDSQIKNIVSELGKVIPIKIETKRLKITIPAQYTGQAYSVVNTYKESEEWKNSGDLDVIVNVPSGLQMEFYDKLNAATHGSAISEEVEQDTS